MPTLDQLLFLAERNSWQDLALCAGNVFFCFTLVPMLRHPARPPLLTCPQAWQIISWWWRAPWQGR
jgi:hypothetical protein